MKQPSILIILGYPHLWKPPNGLPLMYTDVELLANLQQAIVDRNINTSYWSAYHQPLWSASQGSYPSSLWPHIQEKWGLQLLQLWNKVGFKVGYDQRVHEQTHLF